MTAAVDMLRSVLDELAIEQRDLSWKMRRVEAAISATTEALELMTHIPDVRPVEVVAAGNEPGSLVPDAGDPAGESTTTKQWAFPGEGHHPPLDEIAEVYHELKRLGLPVLRGLADHFAAPESKVKNWPGKLRAAGLLEPLQPSPPPPPPPVAPKRKPRSGNCLQCADCGWTVDVLHENAVRTLAQHVHINHGRKPHNSERVPVRTEVPE